MLCENVCTVVVYGAGLYDSDRCQFEVLEFSQQAIMAFVKFILYYFFLAQIEGPPLANSLPRKQPLPHVYSAANTL
jgi:hypothetical protein